MARIGTTMAALASAGLAAGAIWRARRWNLAWGARRGELAARLPGDELVRKAAVVATRAISVAAPASAIWPWLVQIGQDKGGFYSHDGLENLFGLGIHSADQIEPAWQDLTPGDPVYLAEGFGLMAAIVEPGRALVLTGSPQFVAKAPPMEFTWAFVIEPDGAATDGGAAPASRLIVRERYAFAAAWTALMVEPVLWVSLLMSVTMLRGIKARAERLVPQLS